MFSKSGMFKTQLFKINAILIVENGVKMNISSQSMQSGCINQERLFITMNKVEKVQVES